MNIISPILFIDNNLVVDIWKKQGATVSTTTVLTNRKHQDYLYGKN